MCFCALQGPDDVRLYRRRFVFEVRCALIWPLFAAASFMLDKHSCSALGIACPAAYLTQMSGHSLDSLHVVCPATTQVLMSLHASPVADATTRGLVLRTLCRAAAIPAACQDLTASSGHTHCRINLWEHLCASISCGWQRLNLAHSSVAFDGSY